MCLLRFGKRQDNDLEEPGVPVTSLESSNLLQACSSQGRRRSKPGLEGWASQPAHFPPQSAGRLRLALECEEHGGSRCWLVGWSTSGPGPIAFCTGYPPCVSLPTQHPGQGCRIPLEKPVPWRDDSERWGLTGCRQRRREVSAGLPCQHPQPQLSAMSLLSS